MFAPRLSDRFEFDIGRILTELGEVPLNRLHFSELQVQLSFAAELH